MCFVGEGIQGAKGSMHGIKEFLVKETDFVKSWLLNIKTGYFRINKIPVRTKGVGDSLSHTVSLYISMPRLP